LSNSVEEESNICETSADSISWSGSWVPGGISDLGIPGGISGSGTLLGLEIIGGAEDGGSVVR